jgi:chromosomal replication initiator protein
MEQEWQQVKRKLQKSLSKGQYDLWVSTLEFLGCEDGRLILGCQNRFHIEWLREKLEMKLLAMTLQHFPGVRKLEYRMAANRPAEEPEVEAARPHQITFSDLIKRVGPAFNPRFTFDHFVVGSCNQFAYAAAMAMANSQQLYNQSVYLLSDTGLGKSHLTHAVGNYLYNRKPDVRVQYVTTEQFANEMIFSLKNGNMEAFKNKFRTGCDILLLEKIEFLSGKEKIQKELVYTLDELMDRGKKILCTGNAYPKDIPKLNSELQSRLGGVLFAPIEKPDFKTRIEIIKRKTYLENIRVPMEVVEFLADRITGDVRQLESCLVGLMAKSNILRTPITLDLAREVSQTMLDHLPKINIDHIQKIVCTTFKVSLEDLRSTSRRKEIALARKIGMYLAREYTTESLQSIGKSFKRSHSSVLYAVNGIHKEMEEANGRLKREVEYISRRLETSCLSES